MKVLIIGAGETGFYIASEFSEDNYDVTVIDENPSHLQNVQRTLNIAGFRGSGTSLEILENAGIDGMDLVIACTDHDETNLICCLLASHYKVPGTIALTKTSSFLNREVIEKYLKSGISQVINSSLVTAQEIIATATLASAAEVSAFGERNILLVGYRVRSGSPWENLYLKDIRRADAGQNQFLIASIVREGRSFIPTGQNRILVGDYVYILIPRQIADVLNEVLDVRISSSRRAVVAGGNQIASRVTEGLLKSHYQVTMICRDELEYGKMKRRFSHKKNFTAVKGECELVKLQLQLDVAVSALFIAVNNDDHLNIAAGMVAKYLGVQKTICLVNRQDLIASTQALDIDVVISPRLSTARQVKKLIRGGEQTVNYTTISETSMEVVELIAREGAEILNIPLKDLAVPKNTLIGALYREGKKVIIPTGMDSIELGDKVIVVATQESLPKIQHLFEPREVAATEPEVN